MFSISSFSLLFSITTSIFHAAAAYVDIVQTPFVRVKTGAFSQILTTPESTFVECLSTSDDLAHLVQYRTANGDCTLGTWDASYVPSATEQSISLTHGT